MSAISLCIPFVFKNVKHTYISSIFKILELGGIERIDLIPIKNHQIAFIHMHNFNDEKHPQIRTKLDKGEKIKIVYNDPLCWKLYKSYSPKPPSKIPSWPYILGD
jgi:hypothetical protein